MLDQVFGHNILKKNLLEVSKNLPNVLIFAGPAGVGKKHTAYHLIDELCVGTLQGRLFMHPDIQFFEPDTKIFKLEMVHAIQEKAQTTPFELSRKFFILRHADRMNKESANACLKLFEDCPSNVTFILLVENSNILLKICLVYLSLKSLDSIESSDQSAF